MRALLTLGLAVFLPVAGFAQENVIKYTERVTLAVGQSAVIHGIRGECGQNPVKSEISLPALKTGALSLGKPGVRNSGSCGGPTPAIEVIFTATAKGRESFVVEGDKISVRVK